MLKSPTLAPSVEIFKDGTKNLIKSYNANGENYTKRRLRNLTSTCISCHSQLEKNQFKKIAHGHKKLINTYVKSNLDKAHLAYFLRDYPSALFYLKQELEINLMNPSSVGSNEKVLREIIKIYLKNQKDPTGLRSYLLTYKKLKRVNKNKAEDDLVKHWLVELEGWKKPRSNKLSKSTLKDLIKKKLLPIEDEIQFDSSNYHLVDLYYMEGILSNYALKNPSSKLLPEILFWLGMIENQSQNIFLYSLGDMYLKQCIRKYPKSKSAKKCFKAYKDSIMFGFTGSYGTNIPLNVQKELKQLKAMVQ